MFQSPLEGGGAGCWAKIPTFFRKVQLPLNSMKWNLRSQTVFRRNEKKDNVSPSLGDKHWTLRENVGIHLQDQSTEKVQITTIQVEQITTIQKLERTTAPESWRRPRQSSTAQWRASRSVAPWKQADWSCADQMLISCWSDTDEKKQGAAQTDMNI